jgi:uncharacterized membrane protein
LSAASFWAFSDFIMKALVRAEPAAGIEAMQQINKTVIGTQFVAGILLIPVLSIGLAVYAWGSMTGLPLFALLLAAVVFVPSVFLMTLAGNVPMNNRLAALDPTSEEGAAYWEALWPPLDPPEPHPQLRERRHRHDLSGRRRRLDAHGPGLMRILTLHPDQAAGQPDFGPKL